MLAILLAVVPGTLVFFIHKEFATLLGAILTTYVTYWSLILVYTVTYRLSPFHPLAKYPGPLLCKISKGWFAYVTTQGKAHIYVLKLHKQLGSDIIRIGTTHLRIS